MKEKKRNSDSGSQIFNKLIVWVNKWNKPVVVTHSCPEIDPPKQQGKSNIYTAPQGMACF